MKLKHISVVLLVFALSLAAAAAESDAPVAQSDAQRAFDKLKGLAGTWEGTFDGGPVHVTLRVTSMGNTLMHEMKGGGPEDPITMITVDGDQLRLTHYCDVGNQPHMVGTVSPDGKTITFNFVDATNLRPSQGGHMQSAVFNLIDTDHHSEKWEFAMTEGKPMGGVLDLKRSK